MRGVLTDWGGVLTSPLKDAITAWLTAEGLDTARYREVMRVWVAQAYDGGAVNPIHGLEDGTLTPREFERRLAAELCLADGGAVPPDGLLSRMFRGFEPVRPMYEALRRARANGVRTGLVSNSWGNDYPRELWHELFDCVVISSEVGIRKPDERIFQHALEQLGLPPQECVFIDDIQHNVRAAEAIGMVGLHHTEVTATVTRLEELLGVSLTG
ncbi:MAG: HAD-superfamily hydrolase, subfamily variant 3 [Streptosporangiaceae bacterium]|nr:HAD-superfamily hydrolase, subfamily variant 3 [Streptosporangiaceae bacterium]